MKEKKGFTLIELLAVIVILAIIALIATPIVLNLIEKARKGAAEDSAYGIRKTAQIYYQKILLNEKKGFTETQISFNNGNIIVNPTIQGVDFDLDGTKPNTGNITISSDGTIDGEITINSFKCIIPNSGKIECSKNSSATDNNVSNLTANEIVLEDGTTIQDALDDLVSKLNQ